MYPSIPEVSYNWDDGKKKGRGREERRKKINFPYAVGIVKNNKNTSSSNGGIRNSVLYIRQSENSGYLELIKLQRKQITPLFRGTSLFDYVGRFMKNFIFFGENSRRRFRRAYCESAKRTFQQQYLPIEFANNAKKWWNIDPLTTETFINIWIALATRTTGVKKSDLSIFAKRINAMERVFFAK